MSALRRLGINPQVQQIHQQQSASQAQTESAFAYKWAKRETYESEKVKSKALAWMMERYCGNDASLLGGWLGDGGKIILDAGCGSGFSGMLFFNKHLLHNDYLGVDISSSVDVAKERFAEAGYPGDFLQCGLNTIPAPPNSVDIIFSEGVLHHTDSTARSVADLTGLLRPDGLFLFYVYRKKAVIREFCDDHIRRTLQNLSDEEAWKALESLTRLGQSLGTLCTEIDVPEDIPYLGIKKGKLDLQRFFYWNIFKAYYDPDFTLAEMNHINYDWYRPLNCHRHTSEEVKQFCGNAGLSIERFYEDEAGITVVARKG